MYGRAYGFERAMDNLGAIAGPLLALAIVYAIRHAHEPNSATANRSGCGCDR